MGTAAEFTCSLGEASSRSASPGEVHTAAGARLAKRTESLSRGAKSRIGPVRVSAMSGFGVAGSDAAEHGPNVVALIERISESVENKQWGKAEVVIGRFRQVY